jgi:hypothetical protein
MEFAFKVGERIIMRQRLAVSQRIATTVLAGFPFVGESQPLPVLANEGGWVKKKGRPAGHPFQFLEETQ